MGTALVILFLLAVSGLIAYCGDLLGRRIGKKRLTLFRLRPKQTAIVFTVGSGVLIAGVSLIAVAISSSAVRLALTRGEALIRKNAEYRRRLREGEKQYAQSTRLLAAQKGELAAQQQEIGRLHQDERALRGQNGALRTQNEALGRQSVHLQGANQALQARSRVLTASNARLQRDAQRHLDRRRQLEKNIAGVRREMKDASAELIALRSTVDALSNTANRLAFEEHIFSDGEQISRLIIPANPPANVLRRQIEGLVAAVQHEARLRGASPDRQHAEPAYLEVDPPAALAFAGRNRMVNPVEVVVLLAERWASAGDPIVLRAAAAQNCLKGTPVPFEIQVGPNRLVLQKGEELASDRIDGRQSEGDILEDLMAFLQKDVRRRADQLHMIPGANGEVGEMHYEPLLEVVRKVRAAGGWAKVGAVARDKTWTGGQLLLDFYVVREDGDGAKR